MISEIKEEQKMLVQRLGVFELRGLAREMGIPSPTTKKRDELIALILEGFKSGEVKDPKVQKRGRPYKKLTSLEEILSSVVDSEPKEVQYDSIIRFAQDSVVPSFLGMGEEEELEGVARITNTNIVVSVFGSAKRVYVGEMVGSNNIQNGDEVCVVARRSTGEDLYSALSIKSINGMDPKNYVREDFAHGNEVLSKETLCADDIQFSVGKRNACLLKTELYESNILEEIKNKAEQRGSKLVVIGLNTAYENQILIKGLNVKYNFTTPYDTQPTTNLASVVNGLNLVEKLFARGEDVVVVVTDLGGMLLALDECFEGVSEAHKEETKVVAKKLLSLAGSFESGKNVSLIMFYNEIDKDDKFMMGDLFRVCKRM